MSALTPIPGRYALDTNVVIALLSADPSVVARWAEARAVILPAPVLAELLYGARRSARQAENEERVRAMAREMHLAVCDEPVCEQYARVKALLADAGRPIPENDLWVAACSLAAEATLATRDAHFEASPIWSASDGRPSGRPELLPLRR